MAFLGDIFGEIFLFVCPSGGELSSRQPSVLSVDLHENSPVLGPGSSTEGDQVHIDVSLAEEELQQFWVIPVSSNPQSWIVSNLSLNFYLMIFLLKKEIQSI